MLSGILHDGPSQRVEHVGSVHFALVDSPQMGEAIGMLSTSERHGTPSIESLDFPRPA